MHLNLYEHFWKNNLPHPTKPYSSLELLQADKHIQVYAMHVKFPNIIQKYFTPFHLNFQNPEDRSMLFFKFLKYDKWVSQGICERQYVQEEQQSKSLRGRFATITTLSSIYQFKLHSQC